MRLFDLDYFFSESKDHFLLLKQHEQKLRLPTLENTLKMSFTM